MMAIDNVDLAPWVSNGVAIISFVVASLAAWSSISSGAKMELLEQRNAELLEIQTKLSHQAWADEYFRDLTTWANGVSYNLSRAIHLAELENLPENELRDIRSSLSAVIDTGRWYFPNKWIDAYGPDKEPAYRGLRQPVLDHIVHAYDLISNQMDKSRQRSKLIICQRCFVSEIQVVLDPTSRENVLGRVLIDFTDMDRLRGVVR